MGRASWEPYLEDSNRSLMCPFSLNATWIRYIMQFIYLFLLSVPSRPLLIYAVNSSNNYVKIVMNKYQFVVC